MNFNFENISNVETFDQLKTALQRNFNELLSKGYLYKGDMGETPQIVNRPLVEEVDSNGNVVEWSALGKSIIKAIFIDTKYYVNNNINTAALTADGKLNGLNGATYPWWCADGNPDYPIYPATYFVYIDSTPNDIRNNDKDWKDSSCILIPANVEYSDYRDNATAEELEPVVTYHKNHIYPSFYFDSNVAPAGAWCWKINDVETGIPASVANDGESVLGHMFIFEKDNAGIYHYKAGVNPNADADWMTMNEMKEANLRYPIKGDIGFAIKKAAANVEATNDSTDSTATTTSINTLQIYNFVENAEDVDNGGAWGLGGNLISFDGNFYKALWEFISGDSGVDINKGKIILGTNSGNHCIFVKKDDERTGQTLVLMPYQDDPSDKTDFTNNDIWKEAKLQINYPETNFVNDVLINGNLNTNIITSENITNNGDISCKNIMASGDISTEKSISCNEITSNNLVVTDKSIIIGSNTTNTDKSVSVNILSPNFNVTNNYVDTKLPFNSNNNIKISDPTTPNYNIQIHSEGKVKDIIRSLGNSNSTSKDETVIYLFGDESMQAPTGAFSITGALEGIGNSVYSRNVTVNYRSTEFTLPPNMKDISLVMPNSLGITITVKGENKNGSWPYLSGGSIKIKIMASDGTKLCEHVRNISENTGGSFGTTPEFKYCTIYCSFTSTELATASKTIIENKYAYNYIYVTADVTFNLTTSSGIWGQKPTIYMAGSSCKLSSCTSNSSGGSMWSSGKPANSNKDILTANITTIEPSTIIAKPSQVHICSDGILIGSAKDKAAILYIDDTGFNIKYYCPGSSKVINVLSINDRNERTSDVFALKSEIPKSSTTS